MENLQWKGEGREGKHSRDDTNLCSVPCGAEVRTPQRFESLLDEGWEMAIKAREHGESIWVMYRSDDDEIREVYIIVLDPDELVLVKVRGRLDRLFAKVMEEHGDLGELGIRGH